MFGLLFCSFLHILTALMAFYTTLLAGTILHQPLSPHHLLHPI